MSELVERGFWDARHDAHAAESQQQRAPLRGLRGWLAAARTRLGVEPHTPYAEMLYQHVLKRHLPVRPDWNLLEVGCSPGRNLLMANRLFSYRPHGVEYSPTGAEQSRKTLRAAGFDPANIVQADFFSPEYQEANRGRFEVVFSNGFIEHFTDLPPVIEAHANVLKPAGILVCTVPNLRSFNYPFLRLLATDLLAAHNLTIMRLPAFRALFAPQPLEPLFCGYVGMWQLFGVVLRHERSLRGRIARLIDRVGDGLNHLAYLLLRGGSIETRLSPHLVYIGRKRAAETERCG